MKPELKCVITGHEEPIVKIYYNGKEPINVTSECPRCQHVWDIKPISREVKQ